MERELSWHDLTRVIEAHEAYHNYQELKRFCDCYYPKAIRIVVQVAQEYDDNSYYNTFSSSSISVYGVDSELHLPTDDVELLVLLAESAGLKGALQEAEPDRPIDWLEEQYYDDVNNLELCGIEKGYDLEVGLVASPPPPLKVYAKEGAEDALPADV